MQKILRFMAGIVGWTLLCLGIIATATIFIICLIPFLIILLIIVTSAIFLNWSTGDDLKDYFKNREED